DDVAVGVDLPGPGADGERLGLAVDVDAEGAGEVGDDDGGVAEGPRHHQVALAVHPDGFDRLVEQDRVAAPGGGGDGEGAGRGGGGQRRGGGEKAVAAGGDRGGGGQARPLEGAGWAGGRGGEGDDAAQHRLLRVGGRDLHGQVDGEGEAGHAHLV